MWLIPAMRAAQINQIWYEYQYMYVCTSKISLARSLRKEFPTKAWKVVHHLRSQEHTIFFLYLCMYVLSMLVDDASEGKYQISLQPEQFACLAAESPKRAYEPLLNTQHSITQPSVDRSAHVQNDVGQTDLIVTSCHLFSGFH